MLILTTLLWGVSFPLVKTWQNAAEGWSGGPLLSSLTLIALRMLGAFVLLTLTQPHTLLGPTRREHLYGSSLAVIFFVGFTLQVWGMASTSPALSAFFTSLACVWVPVLMWLAFRVLVPSLTWLGLAVGVSGTAVLAFSDGDLSPQGGELLTLAASVLFAIQILILDQIGKRVQTSHLTASFFLASGVMSLLAALTMARMTVGIEAWTEWMEEMMRRPGILLTLALLVILPTVLAFHWMNIYQPRVTPARAALIYLLEPVFTALFSIPWGYDELTRHLVIGGSLILLGNLLVEWRTLTGRVNVNCPEP